MDPYSIQHKPSFQFDQYKSHIRSVNFHSLIPSKPLTDRAIYQYVLQGKYGPELQKRALEKESEKCKEKRVKGERKSLSARVKRILDECGY